MALTGPAILLLAVIPAVLEAAPLALEPKTSGKAPPDGRACYEWIAPFYDFLTLKEHRNMKRSDLSRLFNYMDTTVNGKVSVGEFEPPWQVSTMMTKMDTRSIFSMWAVLGEKRDPTHITSYNQDGIWTSWHPDSATQEVTKQSFTKAMEAMLPNLPNRGCTGGTMIRMFDRK